MKGKCVSGLEFVGDGQIFFQQWTKLRGEAKQEKYTFVCTVCQFSFFDNKPSQPRARNNFSMVPYTALSISRMRLQGVIINTMSGLIHEWVTCGMKGNNKKGNPKYSNN